MTEEKKIEKMPSPSFSLKCGQKEISFQLYVRINTEKNVVEMYLENLSPFEVVVQQVQMKVAQLLN
jgi:hypothetical protein